MIKCGMIMIWFAIRRHLPTSRLLRLWPKLPGSENAVYQDLRMDAQATFKPLKSRPGLSLLGLLSAMRGNRCAHFQAILRLTSRRTGESQTVRESRYGQSELVSWPREFW